MISSPTLLTSVLLIGLSALACPPCTPDATQALQAASNLTLKSKQNLSAAQQNEAIQQHVATTIIPMLDIEAMVVQVIGRYHWTQARAADKATFHQLFSKLISKEYTNNLLKQQNSIHFTPQRHQGSKLYSQVNATIKIDDEAQKLKFYLRCDCNHSKQGQWKIYDITQEQISYLDQYRLQFAATVRNQGLRGVNKKLKNMLTEPQPKPNV